LNALNTLNTLSAPALHSRYLIPALLLGNFVIGTGAMMIAGMLNQLSAEFTLPPPQVAQLLSVFAIVCGVGAPLLAIALATKGRRAVLTGSLLVYALFHALAVITQSFTVLLMVRAFTAIGAAIFTPQAAATVSMLTPPENRGKAVGLIFLGWGLASVVGLPLGSYLAATYHWHAAMGLVAVLSVTAAAAAWWTVPDGLYGQPISLASFKALLRNRTVMQVVGVTILSACGLFSMFAYLAPLMRDVVGASPTQIPLLFACYGFAGLLGSVWVTRYIDSHGAPKIVALCLFATTAMLLLWPLASLHLAFAFVIAFMWGLPGFAVNGTQQARVIAVAGAMAPVAVALNSSAIYLGQAVGTLAGGVYYSHAPHVFLPWMAAGFVGLSLWLSLVTRKRLGV
jgi:predicted MFS family arabinose efflux permease